MLPGGRYRATAETIREDLMEVLNLDELTILTSEGRGLRFNGIEEGRWSSSTSTFRYVGEDGAYLDSAML